MAKRKGTTKLTCDINLETNERLEKLIDSLKHREVKPVNITKTSLVENILDVFLDSSDDIKFDLAEYCAKRKKEHDYRSFEVDGFMSEKESNLAKQYDKLSEFYSTYSTYIKFKGDPEYMMKTIKLKTGLLKFPDNWKTVCLDEMKECDYAYVIEVMDSLNLYHAPHIVVLSKEEINIDRESNHIYREATKVYKELPNLLNMQVDPKYDENGNWINANEWNKSPKIGIFKINDLGTADKFPYQAMIVREDK